MANSLKQILISHTDTDFETKLSSLKSSISQAATFSPLSTQGQTVAQVIEDVKNDGDKAIIKYTKKFDGVKLTADQIKVSSDELEKAHTEVDPKLLKALQRSIANVKKYQQEIFTGKDIPGKIKYTPIERVGLCVPGASAPLPSTVIMTAVPAQVAGIKDIAVISPPSFNGSIHPVILATCHELGITDVYRIGGVQAVAALAYGTASIKKVDMIAGPGNQWVTTAKKYVFGQVGIDSIAGPSDVLIIANDNANPAWVAADMLSQVEHGPGSSAVVMTDSQKLADKIVTKLAAQGDKLNNSTETMQRMATDSAIVVSDSIEAAIELANEFAAEHLEIQCGDDSKKVLNSINTAGAIFVGNYCPVALGDYWAGPSHTLPTGMTAKFTSALSSNDFVKASSIIEYSADQLAASADDIVRLAMTEGLDAHAKSVSIRQQK